MFMTLINFVDQFLRRRVDDIACMAMLKEGKVDFVDPFWLDSFLFSFGGFVVFVPSVMEHRHLVQSQTCFQRFRFNSSHFQCCFELVLVFLKRATPWSFSWSGLAVYDLTWEPCLCQSCHIHWPSKTLLHHQRSDSLTVISFYVGYMVFPLDAQDLSKLLLVKAFYILNVTIM